MDRNQKIFLKRKESISFRLCVLWVLLPVAGVLSALFYGLLSADAGTGWVFLDMLKAYSIVYYILGGVTLAFSFRLILRCSQSLFCRESVRQEPWLYLFGLVLLWSVLSAVFAVERVGSFLGSYSTNDGLLSYFIYAAFLVCALQLKSDEKKKTVLKLFTAVTCLLSVLMLQEHAGVGWVLNCLQSPRAAVFIQFNHFGYILCVSILLLTGLFLYSDGKAEKLYCALAIALQTYTLIINNTFGAYLSVCVSFVFVLLVYGLSGRRLRAVSFVPVYVFFGVTLLTMLNILPSGNALVFTNFNQLGKDIGKILSQAEDAGSAGTTRWRLWLEGLNMLWKRPILGYGPEGLLFTEYEALSGATRPHNEYIQIADFIGIPGLLLYLAALVSLLVSRWKKLKELEPSVLIAAGATFGYLTSAFFGVTIFNTYCYLFLLLGFSASSVNLMEKLFRQNEAAADAELPEKKLRLRKLVPAGLTIAFLAVLTASVVETMLEGKREVADLEAMRCAEAAMEMFLKDNDIPDGEYWFDISSFSLIPAEMETPEPCGMGTAVIGRATNGFIRRYYRSYPYEEAEDYTDAVIHVKRASGKTEIRWKNRNAIVAASN